MRTIEAVYQLLRQEFGLYLRLLRISQEKQGAILKNDTTGLLGYARQEEQELAQLARLEEELAQTAPENFKEIITHDPELHGLRMETLEVVSELQRVNGQNQLLIEQTLALMKLTLQSLRGKDEDLTYSLPGKNRRVGRSLYEGRA